ncbi:Hypothetical_protein [Hexamita inflata]|uniref:Hypothetical_protein n=1 Tax=Hexamita inflata TaxID=28002 RepID=A0AA86R192_9EUKA|nr:Hypothetical protein HINF_LOCUS51369 [Hexamita inflata]
MLSSQECRLRLENRRKIRSKYTAHDACIQQCEVFPFLSCWRNGLNQVWVWSEQSAKTQIGKNMNSYSENSSKFQNMYCNEKFEMKEAEYDSLNSQRMHIINNCSTTALQTIIQAHLIIRSSHKFVRRPAILLTSRAKRATQIFSVLHAIFSLTERSELFSDYSGSARRLGKLIDF